MRNNCLSFGKDGEKQPAESFNGGDNQFRIDWLMQELNPVALKVEVVLPCLYFFDSDEVNGCIRARHCREEKSAMAPGQRHASVVCWRKKAHALTGRDSWKLQCTTLSMIHEDDETQRSGAKSSSRSEGKQRRNAKQKLAGVLIVR